MKQVLQSTFQAIATRFRRIISRLASKATPMDYFVAMLFLAGLAGWSLMKQIGDQLPLLQNPWVSVGIVFIAQALLIIPHELGHAITARMLGYENVRIIIGRGLPLWSADLFGFRWLFNRYWIGGRTLFEPKKDCSTWRSFAVIAAGPAVNVAIGLMLWRYGRLMETWRTFSAPGMLFLANAIVLLENVVPAYVVVGSERIANDGMILARILFRPLMPALTTKRALRFGARALNVAELLLFSVPAIGCVVVTGFFLSQAEWTGMPRLMRTLAALVGMLAIYFGYLAVWRAKQPAKVEQESSFGTPARRGFNELAEQSRCLKDRAAAKILRRLIATESAEEKFAGVNKLLDQFPDDWFLMYLRGASLYELNRHGEAEVVFKNIQQLNIPSLARFSIAAAQVQCLVRAGERKRAESICEEWFTGTAPFEQKTCMVDAFVSIHLYCEQLDDLTFLEKWARRAIELDPNNAAMKETLGGVLVEAGRYAEAEPLLLPQVEGESSTTSKAFAMFYLGLIKAARGDQREAAKMIERATIWSRQKWLLKRAQAKLVELRSSQASVRA